MLTETKSLYSYSQAVVELYIVKSSTCYSVNKNSFFFSCFSLCRNPSPLSWPLCEYTHSTACMWKPEDKFWESPSFSTVGAWDLSSSDLHHKLSYPLSHARPPFYCHVCVPMWYVHIPNVCWLWIEMEILEGQTHSYVQVPEPWAYNEEAYIFTSFQGSLDCS